MSKSFLLGLLAMVALLPPTIEPSKLELGAPTNFGESIKTPVSSAPASSAQPERERSAAKVTPAVLKVEIRPNARSLAHKRGTRLARAAGASQAETSIQAVE